MDYSLLLGVHDVDAADEEEDSSPPGSINNGYFLMPAIPGCVEYIVKYNFTCIVGILRYK